MRKATSILMVLLAFALFWGAGLLNPRLLKQRSQAGFDAGDPLENTPPIVAFTTIALGGFRGLMVDALWLRAGRLQQEGRYFELVQLADWITKLEPRFSAIWAYQAWNMAYNISVMMDDPADRWRWVKHGIELLRDRGLYYNPGDPQLYRELGWIFQHKMGEITDQAHGYYKRAWAEDISNCFHGPVPDYEALAATPDKATLLKDADVVDLIAQLTELGTDPWSTGLIQQRTLIEPVSVLLQTHPGAPALLSFLRKKRLVQELKLQPDVMQAVDDEYGPLDWRLPDAHAIYWAYRGREYAEGFARVNLDRMIFQSLASAFRRGRLYVDPELDIFIPSPNLDLLPRVQHAYEEAIEEFPDETSLATAYANFLSEAITILSSYNRTREAKELFDTLSKVQPDYPGLDQGFDGFVVEQFAESLNDLTPREAMSLVEGGLVQAYFWQAVGDTERSEGFSRMAQLTWTRYMRERADDPEFLERTGLPDFPQIRQQALTQVRQQFQNAPTATKRLDTPAAR